MWSPEELWAPSRSGKGRDRTTLTSLLCGHTNNRNSLDSWTYLGSTSKNLIYFLPLFWRCSNLLGENPWSGSDIVPRGYSHRHFPWFLLFPPSSFRKKNALRVICHPWECQNTFPSADLHPLLKISYFIIFYQYSNISFLFFQAVIPTQFFGTSRAPWAPPNSKAALLYIN